MENDIDINNIFEIRKNKLTKIKEKGEIPYKDRGNKQYEISEVLTNFKKFIGKKGSLCGRIMAIRKHGKAVFADIKDDTAEIQLHISAENVTNERFDYFDELVDVGDFIEITGEFFVTKKGENTVEVSEFKLLSKSLSPLPDKWHGLKDIEKKHRYRYLDMIMDDKLRDRFRLRAKLIKSLRNFLDNRGFLEVETPTLQLSTGGALAKPFKTYYNAYDTDVKLRISLEIPLKKLILGGYEKVYEVGRVYRNEGRDPSHLQEFTQLEFYQAYVNYQDLMEMTEEMIRYVLTESMGNLRLKIGEHKVNMTPPYPRMTIYEIIKKHSGHDLSNHKTADELREFVREAKIDIELDIKKLEYGKLIDEIYKKIARPHIVDPVFLVDHPIDLSPLARVKDNDPEKVDRFQLIVNGWEMLNAYSELIDPIDQEERFKSQAMNRAKGDEEAHDYDQDYVEAMRYGMPPIAGWGMGIDRFMSILTGIDNVREMVLFPFVKTQEENQKDRLVVDKKEIFTGEIVKSKNLIENMSELEKEEKLTVEMFNDKELDKLNVETMGISRAEALKLMKSKLKSKNLQKHSLAVEAILKSLAKKLNADEDVWSIAGLLHDIDYEETLDTPSKHCNITAGVLQAKGVSPLIIQAIRAHNPMCGGKIMTRLDKAIYAVDPLSGFVIACALVTPRKKLKDVNFKSMLKKFKEKSFAKGANREGIKSIEDLGIKLEEFLEIGLEALIPLAKELGL